MQMQTHKGTPSARQSDTIGIFFDVDGTLADSYKLGFDSTNAVLRKHGKDIIDEASYHEGTKYTTPTRLAWHVTGNPSDPIGIELGRDFDELYVELVSTETASLYDGINDLLHHFHSQHPNTRFAALSNANTAYVEAVLQVNKLTSLFPVALGPDMVPAPKPAKDGLLQICDTLGISPTRCVYIGDSPTDGQAGRAAGMHSIGVTWGSHAESKITPHFATIVKTVSALEKELNHFIQACNLAHVQEAIVDTTNEISTDAGSSHIVH